MTLQDPKVIVASPNADFRERVGEALHTLKWPAIDAVGGADALNTMDALAGIDAIVLDHWLPDLDVDDLDLSLRAHHPQIDVLLVDLDAGEVCYSRRTLIHPRSRELVWQLDRKEKTVQVAAAASVSASLSVLRATNIFPMPLPQQLADLPPDHAVWDPLPGLMGAHADMAELARLVRLVAPRRTTVLINGETGTGKEVVAKAIHKLSRREDKPFVAVNCAAIPETLLESELFGYARGAFTGAMQAKPGRIQAADGGTLFLDEIGELPSALQAKLLRFLQEREIQRLGSNESIKVDVRIVAATHVDLTNPAGHKPFRQDLYYRVAVFPVFIPALRERRDDILPLAQHFLDDICEKDGIERKVLSPEVCHVLQHHDWPGNVRELQHVIERAVILAQNEKVLTLKHVPTRDPQKTLNLT